MTRMLECNIIHIAAEAGTYILKNETDQINTGLKYQEGICRQESALSWFLFSEK